MRLLDGGIAAQERRVLLVVVAIAAALCAATPVLLMSLLLTSCRYCCRCCCCRSRYAGWATSAAGVERHSGILLATWPWLQTLKVSRRIEVAHDRHDSTALELTVDDSHMLVA